jgi:hypothetical protein
MGIYKVFMIYYVRPYSEINLTSRSSVFGRYSLDY